MTLNNLLENDLVDLAMLFSSLVWLKVSQITQFPIAIQP